MLSELVNVRQDSKQYNLEKIKWVQAEQYVAEYGMTIPEAYARLASSFVPKDFPIQPDIDFDDYLKSRNEVGIEDQWLLDMSTVEALQKIFKVGFNLELPDSVLAHIFPTGEVCEIIYRRIAHLERR